MVLPLRALPPELLAGIARMCDAPAAAQLARASHAFRANMQDRLAALWAAHQRALSDAEALELQEALPASAQHLLVMNDMGGGQVAIRVAARGAQLCASTTFTCECCQGSRTMLCGHGFMNVQRHLASRAHWTSHRLHVHGLPFDTSAWHAFAASLLEAVRPRLA